MSTFTVSRVGRLEPPPASTTVLPGSPPCCARQLVEAVLDRACGGRGPRYWRWTPWLSAWIDGLLVLEELQLAATLPTQEDCP
jgi:hypothetical protein